MQDANDAGTKNSVENQHCKQPKPHQVSGGMGSEKGLVFGGSIGLQEKMPKYSSGGRGKSKDGSRHGKANEMVKESSGRRDKSSRSNERRRMVAEFYDNDAPKLCDQVSLERNNHRMRPCTPLESYVSTGSDLKIKFHTMTGTSLFPFSFSIKYEFVDTELGGEPYIGQKSEDIPLLCSMVFRKRKGEFQSPRNVLLHGRGGAINITCLYRFEASVGERVRIDLFNVSFGDSATCTTESDGHTGRAKCTPSEADPDGRVEELRLYDVPYKDVKIPLGCFCDNTTSSYIFPLTFVLNSRTMELTFTVTRLNVSDVHDDVRADPKIDPVKEWKHKVSQEEDEEAGEPEEEGSDEKDTESGKSAAKEQVDPEKAFQCTLYGATGFIRNLPVYPMTVKNSGLIIEHLQDLRSAKRFLKQLFESKPYIYDGVKLIKLEHKPFTECPAAEAQRGGRSGKAQGRGRMKRKSNAKSGSRETKVGGGAGKAAAAAAIKAKLTYNDLKLVKLPASTDESNGGCLPASA
ncbi:hypothetical protein pipiens_013313 [Culex pipiens pipiens]|uniref:Uncharacterized protein n=1 Tax=Culex pipiens pipiens TaxID=38569 RepID=A0ABD1D1G7_CULPP